MKTAHFDLGKDQGFAHNYHHRAIEQTVPSEIVQKDRLSKANWVHGQSPVKYQTV